jgi:hypothetical protein
LVSEIFGNGSYFSLAFTPIFKEILIAHIGSPDLASISWTIIISKTFQFYLKRKKSSWEPILSMMPQTLFFVLLAEQHVDYAQSIHNKRVIVKAFYNRKYSGTETSNSIFFSLKGKLALGSNFIYFHH